jgi:hypothetical protein
LALDSAENINRKARNPDNQSIEPRQPMMDLMLPSHSNGTDGYPHML